MHLLTQQEAQELEEHFSSRPDIWHRSEQGAWIRVATTGEPVAVVGLRNGLPEGFYALKSKGIEWSEENVAEYVLWLLQKYTSTWALRQKVLRAVQEGTMSDQVLVRYIADLAREERG